MDNLASSFLKFGDEVLLYSEEMAGYLYSEGWFDQRVYLPIVERDRIKYLQNFIFKISPKLNYEARQQLDHLEMLSLKHDMQSEEDEQQKIDDKEFIKNKQILKKFCTQEEYYNTRTQQSKFGEFVVYGSEVELIHKASNKILTFVCYSDAKKTKMLNLLELRADGRPEK